jgi:membrane-associated phospholipid phosphatase
MLEAAAFSTAAGYILKQAAGRERPYVTADPGSWGNSGDSFPSLHTTAAFAIGTVLAESGGDRYRLLRRVLGYGIAVGTAYVRMDHDAHWLSDTVAGAGLGIATARFVMKRRDGTERRGQAGLVPWNEG